MGLLQDDSTAFNNSARGEDLTKGTSHVVWAAVAATVVMSLAIAIYFIAGRTPPVAKGEILAVWVHPQHIETSGLDANGEAMPKEVVDEILVFTQVRLHNQTNYPLSFLSVLTNATLDDGIHSSYAASKGDYDRVFVAYPGIPVPHGPALATLDYTLGPGQTVEGTFVSAFKGLTKQQWDARKKLDYTFVFRYQPSVVLAPHVAVTEQ